MPVTDNFEIKVFMFFPKNYLTRTFLLFFIYLFIFFVASTFMRSPMLKISEKILRKKFFNVNFKVLPFYQFLKLHIFYVIFKKIKNARVVHFLEKCIFLS